MFTLYPPLFDFSCVTKCMGRRNLVGRCAWAELEWCNYSRTLPILPSFPYLRALPYPFHFPNADKLKTSDALGLDAWRWLVVLAFLCVEAWLASLLVFQERRVVHQWLTPFDVTEPTLPSLVR